RRTDELDFPFSREPVEFGLRNQHRRTLAEDKRGAAAAYFLRCRRHVNLVSEKWKGKSVRNFIMQSHEALFCVDNFFQCLMDVSQDLVSDGGLVERVHDVCVTLMMYF